jgi:hypothetical protein
VFIIINQLTKANKTNIIEYYVYDYQGNRARTVVESDHQAQSKIDYLPSLDISINQAKQQVAVGIKVAGGLLSFSATVVVWVDGEGLLPCVAVCLV